MPDNAKELAKDNFEVVSLMIKKAEVIANMDETPMWFDLQSSHTLDVKVVQTPASKTTGHEKKQQLQKQQLTNPYIC